MFIPTNSDGQVFVNLRKKIIEKKFKNFSLFSYCFVRLCLNSSCLFVVYLFFLFFSFSLGVGPTCPFIQFLVRFSPETIYFVPVSISFIIIEYSLTICHFSEFFKNPVFRFHFKLVA